MHLGARRGFSIMELVVAVGIMGTAVLLIIGIFFTLFHISQKSVDKVAGFTIAESLLVQEAYQICGDPSGANAFWQNTPANPLCAGTYQVNNASYFYRMYAADEVLVNSGSTPFTGLYWNDPNNQPPINPINPRRLDILLWWWDAGAGTSVTLTQASRQGYGIMHVQDSMLLWPSGSY
ncbi:MAG: type II secretion system protein [Candidatus Xenobia bacterium]